MLRLHAKHCDRSIELQARVREKVAALVAEAAAIELLDDGPEVLFVVLLVAFALPVLPQGGGVIGRKLGEVKTVGYPERTKNVTCRWVGSQNTRT
ncbi:hypothetical protein DPMN_060248 [Dreissena polymorpha]|uniref:Uncharacterized protein n=1 Tax=Dreissena polymorpha TaxID=45954 RepID=A0A9D4C588_DREPO|nr:hypothetical protein DPMN_060248 [Dreissena polymorpha]